MNVLKPRRGKASTIARLNPVLQKGELCLELPDDGSETHLGRIKIGDGTTAWNDLPYFISYDLTEYVKATDKGQPNGVVPLNSSKLIDPQYLPAYVDDVLEYPSRDEFPEKGESGKIYIDTSMKDNNVYRWGGTEYFVIAHSVQYHIVKEGSSVVLYGSDGSQSSVNNVGGIEIRTTDPDESELFVGKMWILTDAQT